jgi:hypothetical protein
MINVFEPNLVDPMNGDYSLSPETQLGRPALVPTPVMQWGDTPLSIPTPLQEGDTPASPPNQPPTSTLPTPVTVINLPEVS